jgi:hypothetical protein
MLLAHPTLVPTELAIRLGHPDAIGIEYAAQVHDLARRRSWGKPSASSSYRPQPNPSASRLAAGEAAALAGFATINKLTWILVIGQKARDAGDALGSIPKLLPNVLLMALTAATRREGLSAALMSFGSLSG